MVVLLSDGKGRFVTGQNVYADRPSRRLSRHDFSGLGRYLPHAREHPHPVRQAERRQP